MSLFHYQGPSLWVCDITCPEDWKENAPDTLFDTSVADKQSEDTHSCALSNLLLPKNITQSGLDFQQSTVGQMPQSDPHAIRICGQSDETKIQSTGVYRT